MINPSAALIISSWRLGFLKWKKKYTFDLPLDFPTWNKKYKAFTLLLQTSEVLRTPNVRNCHVNQTILTYPVHCILFLLVSSAQAIFLHWLSLLPGIMDHRSVFTSLQSLAAISLTFHNHSVHSRIASFPVLHVHDTGVLITVTFHCTFGLSESCISLALPSQEQGRALLEYTFVTQPSITAHLARSESPESASPE